MLSIKSVRVGLANIATVVVVSESSQFATQEKHGHPWRYRHTSYREPQTLPFSGDSPPHEDPSQCTPGSTIRSQKPQYWLYHTAGKKQTPRIDSSSWDGSRNRSTKMYASHHHLYPHERTHATELNATRLGPGGPRLPFGGRRSRLGDRKCHSHPLQSDVRYPAATHNSSN